MFSCEFYEISKDTFFTEHLWTTASETRSNDFFFFFFFFELFIFFTLTIIDICFLEYFSHSSKKYLDVNIKSKGNESWNKDKEIHIFTCLWYRWYWSQTCKSQQIYLKKGSFPVSTYFRETHRLMYKNSNSFVYIFVVICQFFSDKLYHMSILFRNNRFLDSCTF